MTASIASWNRTTLDLIGGAVGGMAQAIAGHPLETIKAKIQNQTRGGVAFNGPWDCFRQTLRNEGIPGLYRGLTPPFFMAGMLNAVIFGTNGFMKRLVRSTSGTPDNVALSLPQVLLASEMTAPVYCLFLTPVEVIKVRLQVQTKATQVFRGPLDCTWQLLKTEGVLGLYRGFLPTLGTRLVGLPFYFGTYETAKKFFTGSSAQTPPWALLVAGGIGGTGFWAANYPIDLIKTVIQSSKSGRPALSDTVKGIYEAHGLRGFYRGFTPCIIRAFPANAVAFCGFELTVRALQQQQQQLQQQ